ncbi:MAG TPA: hypothetical protein VGN32_05400, partial [Ktedonobacterales bacterium]|nr:hypothetical protein [Ktedonobacterales bacterium]
MYPAAFLEIQLRFARRMAKLSGMPYPQSVLRNTALYRILGLDWSLDPREPVWQRFITTLPEEGTGIEAAYNFYAERCAQGLVPDFEPSRPHWGCFSFEYDGDTRVVRLHFAANLDTSGTGPLSSRRQEARLADLRAMFAHMRQAHPDAERVEGGSWLYNRIEYRRLFPPEFGTSATVAHPALIARGLWGQFLRHGNRMNEEVAARFLTILAGLRDTEAFAACFPYQNLLTEAPIQCFYA